MTRSAYNVKVTVRNNLILQAMHDAGYETQAALARDVGISSAALNDVVAMRKPPITKEGEFSTTAKALMEFFGAAPTDLWTTRQLNMSLERNTASFVLDEEELARLMSPDAAQLADEGPEKSFEMRDALTKALAATTPREAYVIKRIYGIDCEPLPLRLIGKDLGIGAERVSQILSHATHKIRKRLTRNQIEWARRKFRAELKHV